MTENINQTHRRKKLGYHVNLREEQKVKTLPGHNNVAKNQNMINIGLLHICRLSSAENAVSSWNNDVSN